MTSQGFTNAGLVWLALAGAGLQLVQVSTAQISGEADLSTQMPQLAPSLTAQKYTSHENESDEVCLDLWDATGIGDSLLVESGLSDDACGLLLYTLRRVDDPATAVGNDGKLRSIYNDSVRTTQEPMIEDNSASDNLKGYQVDPSAGSYDQ